MKSLSPTTTAYLAQRVAIAAHGLIWLTARNRTSGAAETIGFWTGEDHATIAIGGVPRLYYGAGALISFDPIRRRSGISVMRQNVKFSHVAPEAVLAVRGYDLRHAPVEIHRALFDPLTDALADTPDLRLSGYVEKVTAPRPAKGERGAITLEISSDARALTITLPRYRSDASLRARAPDDAFRAYATQAATAKTKWGTS